MPYDFDDPIAMYRVFGVPSTVTLTALQPSDTTWDDNATDVRQAEMNEFMY